MIFRRLDKNTYSNRYLEGVDFTDATKIHKTYFPDSSLSAHQRCRDIIKESIEYAQHSGKERVAHIIVTHGFFLGYFLENLKDVKAKDVKDIGNHFRSVDYCGISSGILRIQNKTGEVLMNLPHFDRYQDHISDLLRPVKPFIKSKSPSQEKFSVNEASENKNDMSKYSNSLKMSKIDMTPAGSFSGASTPKMGISQPVSPKSAMNSKLKTVVCEHWLKGTCKSNDEDCNYLHEYDQNKLPLCKYKYQSDCTFGEMCPCRHEPDNRPDCPYYERGFCKLCKNSAANNFIFDRLKKQHKKANLFKVCALKHKNRYVCSDYMVGFCPKGPKCHNIHPKQLVADHEASLIKLSNFPDLENQTEDFNKVEASKPCNAICLRCGEKGHLPKPYCIEDQISKERVEEIQHKINENKLKAYHEKQMKNAHYHYMANMKHLYYSSGNLKTPPSGTVTPPMMMNSFYANNYNQPPASTPPMMNPSQI